MKSVSTFYNPGFDLLDLYLRSVIVNILNSRRASKKGEKSQHSSSCTGPGKIPHRSVTGPYLSTSAEETAGVG